MRHLFRELVLTYPQADRDAWNAADPEQKRRLVPSFHVLDSKLFRMMVQQPSYHFGEFYTLSQLHSSEGWLGFRYFVLAFESDMRNSRFRLGGEQVRKTFPKEKLQQFIHARGSGRTDKGDPDLFLYKPSGEAMFLEVKVAGDRISKTGEQLQALAQIRSLLGCRAEIVHLVPEGKKYTPKTYWVDPAPVGTAPVSHGVL